MRAAKRWARLATAIAVASAMTAVGAPITDGTSNTRTQAGVSTSPGRTMAVRKAVSPQQDYLLLAIPGVRGNGGGATS
jgi:hypothetical protein